MDHNSAEQASSSLNEKLGQLSHGESECTIYRVHKHLKNVNSRAYEPDVIAIGPYHRGKDHLKMMEDQKLHNLKSLTERKGSDVITTYATTIGRLESTARKCYEDQHFNLSESNFIEMLVLDGCFIIELIQNFQDLINKESESVLRMGWMLCSLQRDLMLFENQVPFFVLCELFDLIVGPDQHGLLVELLSNFFSNLYPGDGNYNISPAPYKIKHLLDLIHHNWRPPTTYSSKRVAADELQLMMSATGLAESNVKFEMTNMSATLFDIEFKDGVMLMPPLRIDDNTECLLRNLIVFEQYLQRFSVTFVTDYVVFLDKLIDSPRDVELLSRNHIIKNWLGDDEVVAKMVNRLCDSVIAHDDRMLHYYADIYENVSKHCSQRKNRWMAKLRRNYLHSPWGVISIVAAVVLLLLTLVQTVCSILQVV